MGYPPRDISLIRYGAQDLFHTLGVPSTPFLPLDTQVFDLAGTPVTAGEPRLTVIGPEDAQHCPAEQT